MKSKQSEIDVLKAVLAEKENLIKTLESVLKSLIESKSNKYMYTPTYPWTAKDTTDYNYGTTIRWVGNNINEKQISTTDIPDNSVWSYSNAK